jgi:hypothetical protein
MAGGVFCRVYGFNSFSAVGRCQLGTARQYGTTLPRFTSTDQTAQRLHTRKRKQLRTQQTVPNTTNSSKSALLHLYLAYRAAAAALHQNSNSSSD